MAPDRTASGIDEAQKKITGLSSNVVSLQEVLKDAATREQVHIIQQHLRELSKDFGRFQSRMEKLATHISQAHTNVSQANISARKISNRIEKIEKVELKDEAGPDLPVFRKEALTDQQEK
ncbi:MAG: DNA recombination protein RmuC [Pseudomonadota bacterium]